MTKTTSIITMVAGLALGSASVVHAQPPPPSDGIFVTVGVAAQLSTRTLTTNHRFEPFGNPDPFGETVTATHTVGRGLVFDVSAGRPVWGNMAVALDLSTFHSSAGAGPVSIPDLLFRGRPKSVTLPSELGQTLVALNLQVGWMVPVTDKFDMALFAGPSLIYVKQDVASATVAAGTQNATASVDRESKTTWKAGNASIDLSYKLTDRYGAGVFIRYVGGEVDLPSAPKLKVGGVQVGGGVRLRF